MGFKVGVRVRSRVRATHHYGARNQTEGKVLASSQGVRRVLYITEVKISGSVTLALQGVGSVKKMLDVGAER